VEAALIVVDEDRRGDVHGVDEHQAFLNALFLTAASTFGVMFLETHPGRNLEGQIFCVRLHGQRIPCASGRWCWSRRRAGRQGAHHQARTRAEEGEWSLPGGLLELGESLQDAAHREIKEETGLDVDVGPVIETFDRVHRDDHGRIRYHFVIVDFVCWSNGGVAAAGSDAEGVAWVTPEEIDVYEVNAHAKAVILKGLEVLRS
jgi:ADP-ribose pyrophosphatase YjhB (NUDIX family)